MEENINPLSIRNSLRIGSNDDDVENKTNQSSIHIDHRKLTPFEIVDNSFQLSVIFGNDNKTTVCNTLWQNQPFLNDVKTSLEKESELMTKERLILFYDNIKGDRVRELSIWYHNLLIFLTYKPILIAMHVSFIITFSINIQYICDGNTPVIPLITCLTVMYIGYSTFLSKFLVGYRTGILYDLSKLKKTPDWNPFKHNAASYQFLTGYEIIDSIIVFNLSKMPEIHISYRKAIEERSNLHLVRQLMYFGLILGIIIFPAICTFCFIVDPIIGCTSGKWSSCDGILITRLMADLVFWLILASIIVQVFVMNLLNFSTHFFQVEVFKTRLEIDRTIKHKDGKPGQWKSQRHLIEEYLYHQELFTRSSNIWQGVIFFSLLFTLVVFFGICAFFLAFIANKGDYTGTVFSFFYAMLCVVAFLVFLFLPAQLNSSCSEIISILKKGADSDWELYGSRKELLEYFQSNPLEYTTYKFAITYNWLLGFGASIISTLFAVAISVALGV